MSRIKIENIRQEYNIHKSNLDRFREALIIQLQGLMETNEVPLGFKLESRTKNIESINEKVSSGRYSIKKSFLELQDLVGIRIILIFQRDVQKVSKLIEQNLKILTKYETAEKLKDDQFGYSSLHYSIKIPNDWNSVPTFRGLLDYTAEIQIRTLSQHTWAEASKELQYKKQENIPRPLLRSIGRVSALLETVDLEFERLLQERAKYLVEAEMVAQSTEQSELNVDILQALLERHFPAKNKRVNESLDSLLVDLRHFNINSKEQLEIIINKHKKASLNNDKAIVKEITQSILDNEESSNYVLDKERIEKGVYFSHVGLMREVLELEYKKTWTKYNKGRLAKPTKGK